MPEKEIAIIIYKNGEIEQIAQTITVGQLLRAVQDLQISLNAITITKAGPEMPAAAPPHPAVSLSNPPAVSLSNPPAVSLSNLPAVSLSNLMEDNDAR
jgi:hypothetical protein